MLNLNVENVEVEKKCFSSFTSVYYYFPNF